MHTVITLALTLPRNFCVMMIIGTSTAAPPTNAMPNRFRISGEQMTCFTLNLGIFKHRRGSMSR